MTDFDFSSVTSKPPYGSSGFAGAGGRYGRYLDPRGPGGIGDVNAGLANLAKIAFGGASPNQQEQADALAQDRQAQAALRTAQLAKITAGFAKDKQDAADAQALPANFVQTRYGVPGQQMVDYIAKKVVQPQAETADEPGIVGGYETPAPAGVNPQNENAIRRALSAVMLSRSLPGKTNYQQFEQGVGEAGINQAVDEAGTDPVKLALASARAGATKGTPFFHEGAAGDTLNAFTGTQDQTAPLPQAKVSELKAQTTNQGAQAGLAGAHTAQVRSETLPQVTLQTENGPVVATGKQVGAEAAKGQFGTQLDPAAIDAAASRYRVDGTLPSNLGRGTQGSANTALILNRAAEQAAAQGSTGEAERIRQVSTKATQKALGNTINIAAGIDRAGNILDDHFTILTDLAKKIDPTRIQTLNKAIMAGRTEFNDPVANAYASQMQNVMLEYGRLKAGPNSQAMIPVEAMKLGAKALSTGMDVPSLEAIQGVVRKDVAINRQRAKESVEALKGSMAPSGPTAAPSGQAAAHPASQAEFDLLPKGALYVNPADGRTYTKN